jgi:hypothetical protein
MFKVDKGYYPVSVTDCPTPTSDNLCLKANNNITYTTYNNLGNSFILEATSTSTNPSITYQIKDNTEPKDKSTLATTQNNCPTGFIIVPGSSTYGTKDFCVMKYEAKKYNGTSTTQPVSTANNTPWVNIAQSLTGANNDAIEISQNAVDQSGNPISGAHLITEAEWMTIAQNVLSVPSNWSSSSDTVHQVGTGFIYNGHVNSNPGTGLAASNDDTNSNYGEETYNNSSVGANNKRTLTLTNGEVIWDLSGNVWEWTQGQTTGNQPGLTSDPIDISSYPSKQWNASGLLQNGFPEKSLPGSTGLTNITWQTSSGIGALYSNYYQSALRSFRRGGYWSGGSAAGVLSLYLNNSPAGASTAIGFRVATQPT